MAIFRVAYNAPQKRVTLLRAADAIPSGTTVIGSFDFPADSLDGIGANETYAIYHYVRDILYLSVYKEQNMQQVVIQYLTGNGGTPSPVLLRPAALTARWAVPYTFSRDDAGVYSTNMDIATIKNTGGKTIYMDPVNGANGNDGLTRATAKGTMLQASSIAVANDEIRVIGLTQDTILRSTNGWPGQPGFPANVNVIVEGNFRLIVAGASSTVPTWSAHATATGVIQTPQATAPGAIVDTRFKAYPFRINNRGTGYAVGDTVQLSNAAILRVEMVTTSGGITAFSFVRAPYIATVAPAQSVTSGSGTGATWIAGTNQPMMYGAIFRAADLATCLATRGTWFNDGTNTYYNTLDAQGGTGQIAGIITTNAGTTAGSMRTDAQLTQYIEGIDFIGGNFSFSVVTPTKTNKPIFGFNKVSFQGATTNGLAISAYSTSYLYRCGAYFNGNDGFNWHGGNNNDVTMSPDSLAVECWGQGNGCINSPQAGTSDNDFTTHEAVNLVLVNCVGAGSDDRTWAFVGTSITWATGGYVNMGCRPGAAGTGGGEAIAVLDTAQFFGDGVILPPDVASSNSRQLSVQSGATFNYRNMSAPVGGSGTIQPTP